MLQKPLILPSPLHFPQKKDIKRFKRGREKKPWFRKLAWSYSDQENARSLCATARNEISKASDTMAPLVHRSEKGKETLPFSSPLILNIAIWFSVCWPSTSFSGAVFLPTTLLYWLLSRLLRGCTFEYVQSHIAVASEGRAAAAAAASG